LELETEIDARAYSKWAAEKDSKHAVKYDRAKHANYGKRKAPA
jgi:hypothetical protein